MREQFVPIERIAKSILVVRHQKVLLDADLAEQYGVETKVLNQAVRRNAARFPADLMFHLNAEEQDCLRSQFVTLNAGRGRHRELRALADLAGIPIYDYWYTSS